MPYGPMFSIRGRSQVIIKDDLPGRCSYNQEANDVLVKERSPSQKFGSEPREKLIKDDIHIKETGPSWKFGTQEKGKFFSEGLLGPGEYSPREVSPHSHAPVIGQASRTPLNQLTDTPGLGIYGITSQNDGPHYTIKGKFKETEKEEIPGTESYEPEKIGEKGPSYKFGSENRGREIKDENPGPVTYEIVTKETTHGWKFGSEERSKVQVKETPGPTDYSPKDPNKILKGTAERQPLSKIDENPGVGTYYIVENPEGPDFTMQRKYQEYDKDQIPGPGSYIKKQGLVHHLTNSEVSLD